MVIMNCLKGLYILIHAYSFILVLFFCMRWIIVYRDYLSLLQMRLNSVAFIWERRLKAEDEKQKDTIGSTIPNIRNVAAAS